MYICTAKKVTFKMCLVNVFGFTDCNLNKKKIEQVSWNLNILATKSYV